MDDIGNPFRTRRPLSTHPVDVGLRTEAIVAQALIDRGHTVLVPRGENHRYDLVVDDRGRFLRIQCKTGQLRSGSIQFATQSVRCNTRQILTRGYAGEVDYFGVYCPETDRVYLVPFEQASRSLAYLRVDPTRNNQVKGIRWAADFELAA